MGDASTPGASPKSGDAWPAFQAAMARLAEDALRQALPKVAPAGRAGAADTQADLKKAVADTVTAVLLETSLLDRLIERHLKARPAAGGEAAEDIRGLIQKEIRNFSASQELKESIDDKFRSITLYLKTEVIPRVVRETLARAEA